jgi:hypothetical protein
VTGIILRIVLPSAIGAVMIAATVVWFVHNDRERRALDDARDRLETIDTVKGLENEAENTSDNDLADSISDVQ